MRYTILDFIGTGGGNAQSINDAIAAAPVKENEAAAAAAGLASDTLYKTSTGELRFKLAGSVVTSPNNSFPYTFPKTF